MKLFIRLILFYCCFTLISADLVSYVLKVNDYCIVDSETEKNEEQKEDLDDKLEEKFSENVNFPSFYLFSVYSKQCFLILNEKLISQVHIEISTPPPNLI